MKPGTIVDILDGVGKGERARVLREIHDGPKTAVAAEYTSGPHKGRAAYFWLENVRVRDPIADAKAHPGPGPLIQQMAELVAWIRHRHSEGLGNGDPHRTLYHATAERFHLYNADGLAPIWLSRVVAGVLEDLANHDTTTV